MKRQITIILIILTLGFSQKINLNSATLEELHILELTDDQIESILDYRSRSGYIHNIYDLLNLTNITINDIHAIRNVVTVDIPQASTFEKDMARASYKMGRWISNEGSTEGLSEVWLDRFIEPQNINNMNYGKKLNYLTIFKLLQIILQIKLFSNIIFLLCSTSIFC